MDSQMKKGMYDYLVLSAVRGEPSYGYKIIQSLSGVADISESTLYPILRRLEEQNALATHSVAISGRLRKYYVITETGAERLREFRDEWKKMKSIADYIIGRNEL